MSQQWEPGLKFHSRIIEEQEAEHDNALRRFNIIVFPGAPDDYAVEFLISWKKNSHLSAAK